MRQALEMALDWIKKQPEETPESKYDVDTRYVVLRELEAALANPEQAPVVTDEMVDAAIQAFWGYENKTVSRTPYRHAIQAALNKSATSAKDENDKFCDNNCVWTDHHPDCKLAQPKQEPVTRREIHAWMESNMPSGTIISDPSWWAHRIYIRFIRANTQPRCKPLTDGQRRAIIAKLSEADYADGDEWDNALFDAIEAAHSIKEMK